MDFFTQHIRGYCNDNNIDTEDWCSLLPNTNYVVITGDVTLDQIGRIYDFFMHEYPDIKIEFINYLGLQYCFKISKS